MSQLLQYLDSGMPTQDGFASPSMSGYGFNWYGGQPQIPQGGYYNQMAQSMAGPSYAPVGSNWYSGGGSAPSGIKGAIGSPEPTTPSLGGKGTTTLSSPSPSSPQPNYSLEGPPRPYGGANMAAIRAMGGLR